jgi:acyl-CoA thioesterase YciA
LSAPLDSTASAISSLRLWRVERGLTLTQVAEAIGVTHGIVSKWERSKVQPNFAALKKLAELYDVSAGELVSGHSTPLIRVTAMPADTNPYGGVFGGWLIGQMGLACGSFASRRTHGKAILVAADALKFPGAMTVGDELSVYVELLKQGRTSLRLKAEAVGRQRDGDAETTVAEGEFTFVALDEAGKPREIGNA